MCDRRPGDPPVLASDSDRSRWLLGWAPKYPKLEDQPSAPTKGRLFRWSTRSPPEPGGMAAYFGFDGLSIERFYHLVLQGRWPLCPL